MPERAPDQTVISISLPKELLGRIDARARYFGMARSQYLAILARQDISKGGLLTLPPAEDRQSSTQLDLTAEAIEFLNIAIPALTEYQNDPQASDLPEPPETLAESALWQYFLEERDEILRHKYFESQKAGHDIGMDRAIRDWLKKHHALWAAAHPPATS